MELLSDEQKLVGVLGEAAKGGRTPRVAPPATPTPVLATPIAPEPSLSIPAHTDAVMGTAIVGDRLWTVSKDGSVAVWSLDDGRELARERDAHSGRYGAYTVAEWGRARVATGGTDANVKVWRFENGGAAGADGAGGEGDGSLELLLVLRGHWGHVRALCSWGGWLCSAGEDKTVRVWREGGHCVRNLKGHADFVLSLVVWDDRATRGRAGKVVTHERKDCDDDDGGRGRGGGRGAAGDGDGNGDGNGAGEGQGGQGEVHATAGGFLCSGDHSGDIRLWDPDLECVAVVRGAHREMVYSLSVWGGSLLSASWDWNIKRWQWEDLTTLADSGDDEDDGPDPASTRTEHTPPGVGVRCVSCFQAGGGVYSTLVLADGEGGVGGEEGGENSGLLLLGLGFGRIEVRNLGGKLVQKVEAHATTVQSMKRWHPSSSSTSSSTRSWLITGSWDTTVRMWETRTGGGGGGGAQ